MLGTALRDHIPPVKMPKGHFLYEAYIVMMFSFNINTRLIKG